MGQTLGVIDWEPHAQPEVALVLPQSRAKKAPQDHAIVCVVIGFPEYHILVQMTFCTNDVVHPGPHLLATMWHAPRPSILLPRKLVREGVLCHVLKILCCHR